MASAAGALRCQLELLEQQLARQSQSLETLIQNAEKQIFDKSESKELQGTTDYQKTLELFRNLLDNKAGKLEVISLQGFEIIGNSAKTVSEAVLSIEIGNWKNTLASNGIEELANRTSDMVAQLENSLHACSSGNAENSYSETNLPEFCGDPAKFKAFMDVFNETVGKDNRKSDVEKFKLLLSCCKGEAKQSLEMIHVRAESYALVLEHLKLRYGDRDLAALSIKHKLEGLPQANYTTSSLWFTLNTVKALVMELENLGIKADDILSISSMVLEKFPPQMRRTVLEQQIGQRKNTLIDLFSLIETEIQVIQIMESGRGINWKATDMAEDNGKILCALCKSKEHVFDDCDRYHSRQMRYDRVVKLRMFAICLSTFHKTRKCQQPVCYYCKGHHNTVLCTVQDNDAGHQ